MYMYNMYLYLYACILIYLRDVNESSSKFLSNTKTLFRVNKISISCKLF